MIELRERTADSVKEYYEKANLDIIKYFLPQKATTLDEALSDYYKTLLPNATSYGQTIWRDNVYVGDVWCYCIDKSETPNAMISYCIFEQNLWSKGIASEAVSIFIREIEDKFHIDSIGAFLYTDNVASIRVLEKNKFVMKEKFIEDGRESLYFQR